MSLISLITQIPFLFTNTFTDHSKENKEKKDEAVKKYWDACKLPRKQKKKARKEANYEYRFWVGLQKWEDEFRTGKLTL